MSLQIAALMEKSLQEERMKNEAQLEAMDYRYRYLQGQMSPHFIYNALETVNALSKLHNVTEISSVVQRIARYFRNIVQYSDHQFITLGEEMEALEIYIDTYRCVQQSSLLAEVNCPKSLAPVQIPSMMLQPIVENCFVHGFRSGQELIVIRIAAVHEKEGILVTVEDNGEGIPEEVTREEFDRKLKKRDRPGIGLSNIRERLAMLYERDDLLTIESSPFGTTVRILFPVEQSLRDDGADPLPHGAVLPG